MISVSIVSYNTSELLEKTIRNLLKQDVKPEIWVTDNNSSDDSVEMVKKKFPQVKLIESEKNLGFGAGQNLALKKIDHSLILLLNPDTEFPDDALSKMVKFMEENPECGIASVKLLDKKGRLTSNGGYLPTGIPLISWLFNLDKFGLPSFHMESPDYYKGEAGWVGGTFMVIRKKVLETAGYFSDDYFMYFEDVDFCYRARKKGFKIMYNSDVEVVHYSGASSKDPRFAQWVGEFKGLLTFSYKNKGFLYGLIVHADVVVAILLRIILFAITGKLNYSKTYLKVLANL
jgi:GT2 family glycosyltransferase